MANKLIDLSGLGGLTTRYHGDLNDSSGQPNLRYLGNDNQFASGIFNPFKKHGYISPANNTFTSITGTISDEIGSVVFDSVTDQALFAEIGQYIRTLSSGLDDTSLSEYYDGVSTREFLDMEMYEVAGKRALVYCSRGNDTDNLQNMTVGFYGIDSDSGARHLEAAVIASGIDNTAEISNSANTQNQKFAQKITNADVGSSINRVRVRLGALGSTTTYTIRIGIQADSSGDPSGSYSAFADVDPADLIAGNFDGQDIYVDLSSTVSLPGSTSWLVVEATDWSDMTGTATNGFTWYRSDGDNSQYANGEARAYDGTVWNDADASTSESFDFSLISLANNGWVPEHITGNAAIDNKDVNLSPQNAFIEKADNGILYWFVDNVVHGIDGSITGGNLGTLNANAITFPSYLQCVDAVDTEGKLHIALHSTRGATASDDDRTFNGDVTGVYIWDRQSTVLRTRNFIPMHGVREISNLFVDPDGDVLAIVINNSRFAELRMLVNGRFKKIASMETDAMPRYRKSVDIINNAVIWQGINGMIYAYGAVETTSDKELYIIGDVSGEAAGTFKSGTLLVGHEQSGDPRQGVFLTFTDNGTAKVVKWYPNGEGTIDSNAQNPHQGDIYTLVQPLDAFSTVHEIDLFMIPGTNTGSTTVANLKIYFNQSSTPWATKAITQDDIARGFKEIPVNKPNVSFVQLEIEYVTSHTLGTDDFVPMYAQIMHEKEPRLRP
jgi:hypothetical protein